ncbi:hypothetical protein [Pararhizobium mangrovi]|uniref:Uncharacterized protein n=1 Tax=Pararhizobium mangrovi TaxID=2590452 RepID=A0A506U8I0_9HYPH|nr:hypothetical protein [Pararhizobium mangrovi]TPW29646.1 hypothetical protein FJU11_07355 [Pararhizobium mangrovi]
MSRHAQSLLSAFVGLLDDDGLRLLERLVADPHGVPIGDIRGSSLARVLQPGSTLVRYDRLSGMAKPTSRCITKALSQALHAPDPAIRGSRIILEGEIPNAVNPPKG